MSQVSTKFIKNLAVTAPKVGSGAATSVQPLFADGSGGASFRSIVSGDIPTLNQNTTGTASNITGVLATANGGTNITSYTTGDTLYAAATNVLSKLPVGTTGQVLTVVGGLPAWSATAAPTLSSLGIRAGSQSLSSASTTQAITFSSTLGTTSYAISATMVNTTDTNPQFQPITITAQSATGFTATWNAPTATANYSIQYHAIVNV
jgi:hypothetical protein